MVWVPNSYFLSLMSQWHCVREEKNMITFLKLWVLYFRHIWSNFISNPKVSIYTTLDLVVIQSLSETSKILKTNKNERVNSDNIIYRKIPISEEFFMDNNCQMVIISLVPQCQIYFMVCKCSFIEFWKFPLCKN